MYIDQIVDHGATALSRRVRNAQLETRTARLKLTPRGLPYWVNLEQGLHLGYRRLKSTTGRWVVRFYLGKESVKAYEKRVIAQADDYSDADGVRVLSYDQAQEKARALNKRRLFAETVEGGPYTVQRAIDDYIAYLQASGKDYKNARHRAYAHIVPALGNVEVAALTSARLRQWLSDIAHKRAANDEEQSRRNKTTANRTLTVLKAALNHAYDERRVESNDAWGRRVKPFRGVDSARVRYLSVDEAQRLINAAQGEFRDLVQAALQTGCRFSELMRLVARDYEHDTGTLFIAKSKTGKSRHVVLTEEGQRFFASLCAGRSSDERLFSSWGRMRQNRAMQATLARARIAPVTFHGLRHTWASLAVMNGVPLQVIAQNLGHSGTRMVEKHYGHMSRSHVVDLIRRGAPRYGFETNVVPHARRR